MNVKILTIPTSSLLEKWKLEVENSNSGLNKNRARRVR